MFKRVSCLLIVGMLCLCLAPNFAHAKKGEGKHAELLFKVVNKLMSKGDQSVISIGRVLKAETYLKKLKQPEKALAELQKLETEITDKELLFAANTIRMLIMKEAEKNPQKLLDGLEGVIASAKERACK